MNKEKRNNHVVPFARWVARGSSVARCAPQTIIPGKVNELEPEKTKKDRLYWDDSTKCNWWKTTMNEVTLTDKEADITFGYVYMAFYIWIFNLWTTFPNKEILLAFINISSCFRWPCIFPCLVGAFGFMIGPLFHAANAMIFGSVASATSGEPF